MKTIIALGAVLLAAIPQARAVEYISYGLGNTSCQQYNDNVRRNQEVDLFYEQWMIGFLA
jgi:hypothetical protein